MIHYQCTSYIRSPYQNIRPLIPKHTRMTRRKNLGGADNFTRLNYWQPVSIVQALSRQVEGTHGVCDKNSMGMAIVSQPLKCISYVANLHTHTGGGLCEIATVLSNHNTFNSSAICPARYADSTPLLTDPSVKITTTFGLPCSATKVSISVLVAPSGRSL